MRRRRKGKQVNNKHISLSLNRNTIMTSLSRNHFGMWFRVGIFASRWMIYCHNKGEGFEEREVVAKEEGEGRINFGVKIRLIKNSARKLN